MTRREGGGGEEGGGREGRRGGSGEETRRRGARSQTPPRLTSRGVRSWTPPCLSVRLVPPFPSLGQAMDASGWTSPEMSPKDDMSKMSPVALPPEGSTSGPWSLMLRSPNQDMASMCRIYHRAAPGCSAAGSGAALAAAAQAAASASVDRFWPSTAALSLESCARGPYTHTPLLVCVCACVLWMRVLRGLFQRKRQRDGEREAEVDRGRKGLRVGGAEGCKARRNKMAAHGALCSLRNAPRRGAVRKFRTKASRGPRTHKGKQL